MADTEPLTLEAKLTNGAALPEPVIVLSTVLGCVGLVTGALTLTAVCALVLATVGCARAWARLALLRVRISRELSATRAFVGERMELRVALTNAKRLPLPWVRLAFTVPSGMKVGAVSFTDERGFDTEYRQGFFEAFSLGAFQRLQAVRPLVAERRGCFRLGAASIESGDLFGFFLARASSQTHAEEIVVYPSPLTLPGFELPPRAELGSASVRPNVFEDPIVPRGLRDYLPGDPINHIDWKATAKAGTARVRLYDSTVGQELILLLECETADRAWQLRPERLETAVSAAATIAMHAIAGGWRVGLLTNGMAMATGRALVQPGRGDRALQATMNTLARVQARPSRSLRELAEGALKSGQLGRGRDAVFVYLTAMTRSDLVAWLELQCRMGAHAQCVYTGDGAPAGSFAAVRLYHQPRTRYTDANHWRQQDDTVLHA